MINSICIVRLSALGDVLMLVPLVRRLQDNFPHIKITWIISRPAFFLVEGMEGVEFIVIDKPKNPKDYWQFYQRMRYRYFDVLLATQACFRAHFLYPFIRAKRKIGYDKKRAKDAHLWFVRESITPGYDHTLEGFLKFAAPLDVKATPIRWDMPITSDDYAWAEQQMGKTKKPVVIINPAASKPERSWLVERYIAVIRYLQDQKKASVILTGGPTEHDNALAMQIVKEATVTNLVGKTKPKQLMAVIAQADLVLCPDTGPAHMAGAVGTPVIALHAVTNPAISGPYPYRHLVVDCYLKAAEMHFKNTDDVWGKQVHGMSAMQLIEVDEVVKQIERVLA